MADHRAKAALYDALAESAKALANGRRAELVDVLAQGERSVEELAEEIDQTVANTSQHLQRLLRSGLVESRREGTRIYYSLSSPVVGDLWRTMRRAAQEHVSGLERLAADYLGDRSKLRTMTRDDLRGRLRDGDVVVLDVRPEAEFAAGHIRGAVSIPITELKSRLGDIPDGADVVAYCRGRTASTPTRPSDCLRRRAFAAARLEDGFPEWLEARLPVARRTPGSLSCRVSTESTRSSSSPIRPATPASGHRLSPPAGSPGARRLHREVLDQIAVDDRCASTRETSAGTPSGRCDSTLTKPAPVSQSTHWLVVTSR